jgi:hypothetical protein
MYEVDSVNRSGSAHVIAEIAGRIRSNHAAADKAVSEVPSKKDIKVETSASQIRPAISGEVRSMLLSSMPEKTVAPQNNIQLISDLLSTIRQYEKRIR